MCICHSNAQSEDWQALAEERGRELADLQRDYDDLGKTFGEVQDELELVR